MFSLIFAILSLFKFRRRVTQSMTGKKLNLGSGRDYKQGWVNLDWNDLDKPDIVHDLNKFPYPFEEDTFDLIEANHILEHLDRPFEVMRELHRILKSDGTLIVRVPHFSRGFPHPEHAHGFDVTFPMFFDKSVNLPGYYGFEFDCVKITITWEAFIDFLPSRFNGIKPILRLLNAVISFFANLNIYLFARIWCYWVGGASQVEFIFNKK